MEEKERIRLEIEVPIEYKDSNLAVLCYENKGNDERKRLDLDHKDLDDNYYLIIIPKKVVNMSSSYIGGLFRESVQNISSYTTFKEKYEFEITEDSASCVYNIQREIDDIYTEEFFDRMRNVKEKKNENKATKPNMAGIALGYYLVFLSILGINLGITYKLIYVILANIPALILGLVSTFEWIVLKGKYRMGLVKNEKTRDKEKEEEKIL